MSNPNAEDRKQAIYDDLENIAPREGGTIQMMDRCGASLRQCEQAINDLVNKIYEDQSI